MIAGEWLPKLLSRWCFHFSGPCCWSWQFWAFSAPSRMFSIRSFIFSAVSFRSNCIILTAIRLSKSHRRKREGSWCSALLAPRGRWTFLWTRSRKISSVRITSRKLARFSKFAWSFSTSRCSQPWGLLSFLFFCFSDCR